MATKTQKRTMMALNAVYTYMSDDFKKKIPKPNLEAFGEFANPLFTYQTMMNEFLDGLVNKIGLTIVQSKIKNNPLALLKKGDKPMGADVEEIFVEMAKIKEFDATGQTLLSVEAPDVRAIYHRINYRGVYNVSWSEPQIKHAFTSVDNMTDLINKLIDSLYAGAYDDEFTRTKLLVGQGVADGKITTQTAVLPTDLASAKALAKQIKKASMGMTFTSAKYNKAKKLDGSDDPVRTFTETSQQVLLINADALVEIDVELLATAFNMNKADFNMIDYVIAVDDFKVEVGEGVDAVVYGDKIIAVLADRATFQIYDDQFKLEPLFYNPANQTQKGFLHIVQTYSLSLFSNALAFVEA